MAFSYNQITLIGNLGRDPELRFTGDGKAVASISIACGRSYTKGGEKHDETDWFAASVWGQPGQFLAENAKKGDRVFLSGSMQSRKYTARDGSERTGWEVVAFNSMLLSPKRESAAPSEDPDKPFTVPADPAQSDLPF